MIAYARAAGRRAVEPGSEPMTRDTVFDMASLTKPVATATSIMILVDEGKIRLADRLVRLLPEFDNHGKGAITIEQLLRHRGGFRSRQSAADYKDGPDAAWKRIAELELVSRPGERFSYSDVGFQVLGKLVERTSGRELAAFAREHIFEPLGMSDAHFRPVGTRVPPAVRPTRIAPTERETPGGPMLRGVVHDPRCSRCRRVAGHAGLFATADDLAIFAQTLLNGGVGPNGRRVLSPLAVRAMIDAAATPAGQRRGLGWDVADQLQFAARDAVGGSQFRPYRLYRDQPLDRPRDRIIRHHPDQPAAPRRPWPPAPTSLRAEVATLAAAAIVDALSRPALASVRRCHPEPDIPVEAVPRPASRHHGAVRHRRSGRGEFPAAAGLKIGLVTNHTGRTRDGKSTIDVLFHAPGVTLVRLFSPEHGIRARSDAAVPDGKDDATGLPIISLYGKDQEAACHGPRRSRRPGLRHPGHRRTLLYLYHNTWPRARSGQGERQEGIRARPSQRDRRPGRFRAGARSGIRLVHRLSSAARAPRDDSW